MQCPHCLENHPDGTVICPVTGYRISESRENPKYQRSSDFLWFSVLFVGVFLVLLGLSILNNFSLIEYVSDFSRGNTTVKNNTYGDFVQILITQINSSDYQLFAYSYDYNDTQGTVEFEDQNIYISAGEPDIRGKKGTQISFSGRSGSPVWSPDGRYLAFVVFGSDYWDNGWIIIYDIQRREQRIIQGNYVPKYLAWSPDGSKLAFSDIKYDQISILNLATESVEIVDRDGHWVDGPTWSLDGRFLAYVQTKGSNTNDDDGWVLKILDLETMKVSQVTTTNDNIGILRQNNFILWTADGKHLVYIRFLIVGGERQPYELWVLDPYSLETYKLEDDVFVVDQRFYPWARLWSPTVENVLSTEPIDDYTQLVSSDLALDFLAPQNPQESSEYASPTQTQRAQSIKTATPLPIPTNTPLPSRPVGNPMIAYAYGDFDEAEIFILYVNSGKTVRITKNDFEDKAPSFSPDNTKLVYQSKRDQGWELYTYDLETGEEKRITTFNAEAKFPNWSPIPGDDRIVFEGRQGVYGKYDINVWMVNSDGTGLEQLTFSNADNRPIWSGDGSVIIFGRATKDSSGNGSVSSSDNLDIFTIDPESKEITQITETDEIDEFQFGTSPDGTLIVFCAVSSDVNNDGFRNLSDTRDLHFININGSNRSTVKLNDKEIFSPDISPDGQFVSFNIWFNDNDSAIWLYNLATGDITELTSRGPYYHPEWSH